MLREQGFSSAADAALKYVPEGNIQKAAEAMTDEVVDTVTIAGTQEECRHRLAEYEGVVDEVIFVNVSYASGAGAGMIEGVSETHSAVVSLLSPQGFYSDSSCDVPAWMRVDLHIHG